MTMTNGKHLASARRLASLMLAAVLCACALCLAAPQQEAQAKSYKTLCTWDLSDGNFNQPVTAEGGFPVQLEVATRVGLILRNNTFQEIPESTLLLHKKKGGFDEVHLPAIPPTEYLGAESPYWQLGEGDTYVSAELVVASDVFVTFDLNGHGRFPDGLTLEEDGTYKVMQDDDGSVAAPTPVDDAYDFTGWTFDEEGLYPFTDKEEFGSDTTVYAQWEPKPGTDDSGDGDGGNGNGTATDDSDAAGDSDSGDEYVTSPATGVTAAPAEESPVIPAAILTAMLLGTVAAAFALRKRLEL